MLRPQVGDLHSLVLQLTWDILSAHIELRARLIRAATQTGSTWPLPSLRALDFNARADWRSVKELYGQFTTIVSDKNSEGIPSVVTAALATSLGRVLAFYEDAELQFVDDLLELWSGADRLNGPANGRFERLYFDERLDRLQPYAWPSSPPSRRRPRPFEAAVETCRRLSDINRIRAKLSDLSTAAVLGGSVSYGRFYNVKGAAERYDSKSSDADLLLVVKDYDQLNDVGSRLATLEGVDQGGAELLCTRLHDFAGIRQDYPRAIFSHKLRMWTTCADSFLTGKNIPSEYNISLHVFSRDDFDFMTLKDAPIIESHGPEHEFERKIYDYRDTETPKTKAYDNRSFSGIPLGTNPLNSVPAIGGFVSTVCVCMIKQDRYCPGLHQNLILPQFEKRWESDTVRLYLRMLSFRWKILERLRLERTTRPFEEQTLSLSHVRYFVFSPHITSRADRS